MEDGTTETAHTTPRTTREEARRALSGAASSSAPLNIPRVSPPSAITSLEKREAIQELSGDFPKKYSSPVPKTAPLTHTIITQTKPVPALIKEPASPTKSIPQSPLSQTTSSNSYREPIPSSNQTVQTVQKEISKTPSSSVPLDPPKSVQNKAASLAEIAIRQEEERRALAQQSFVNTQHPRRRTLIFGGAILVFAIGGGIALYLALSGDAPKPIITLQKTTKQFIIKPDTEYALHLGKDATNIKTQLAEAITKQNKTDGAIGAFVITIEDVKKKQMALAPPDMLYALSAQIPRAFIKSLGAEYMAGRFAGDSQNSAFFVLSIESYEDAFAGLQNWYAEDALLFAQLLKNNSSLSTQNLSWKNVFIKNIDARILINNDDEIFMVYTFLNKKTFLLSADKESFLALVERYTTPQKPLP